MARERKPQRDRTSLVIAFVLHVVLIGGVAKDVGFVASLKRKLGVDLSIPEYPEFAGAYGAALIAAGRAKEA